MKKKFTIDHTDIKIDKDGNLNFNIKTLIKLKKANIIKGSGKFKPVKK